MAVRCGGGLLKQTVKSLIPVRFPRPQHKAHRGSKARRPLQLRRRPDAAAAVGEGR